MKSVPPRCRKPRSSTERTRSPMLTLARIGLSAGVERLLGHGEVGDANGDDALLAPDEERQRRLQREDLEHARPRERVVRLERVRARMDEALERRQLRVDAESDGVGVARRVLEPVGGVDLGLELDRLDAGALEAERLRAIAALAAARLHLQRARERVRVVLERDHAQDPCGLRVDLDDPALQKPWRERCHAAQRRVPPSRARHARITGSGSTRLTNDARRRGAMRECDARTQGAPIPTYAARLRTKQRAAQRIAGDTGFIRDSSS